MFWSEVDSFELPGSGLSFGAKSNEKFLRFYVVLLTGFSKHFVRGAQCDESIFV